MDYLHLNIRQNTNLSSSGDHRTAVTAVLHLEPEMYLFLLQMKIICQKVENINYDVMNTYSNILNLIFQNVNSYTCESNVYFRSTGGVSFSSPLI